MKLYQVPRKTKIRLIMEDNDSPPASLPLLKDDILFFDHLDGMYSFCIDELGNIVHLAGYTEVEIVN